MMTRSAQTYFTLSQDSIRSVRPSYWLKNLVFVAPFLLQCCAPFSINELLLGFIAWCLASSGQYVINDVLNKESDRLHSAKKDRPIAAGRLGVRTALGLGIILWGSAITIASFLHFSLLIAIILYFIVGLLYSAVLKSIFLVDAVCLAFLFLLRFTSGVSYFIPGLALDLNAFAFFYFFNLVFLKRLIELDSNPESQKYLVGRGYAYSHRNALIYLGMASVLVLLVLSPTSWTESYLFSTSKVTVFKTLALLYLGHLWVLFLAKRVRGDLYQHVMRSKVTYMASLFSCLYYFFVM